MIKIAFFDIDGTILNFGSKDLSPKVLYALKELKKNNVLICFASGRGNFSIPTFDGITPDVIASFNGAYCYNKDQIIFEDLIDKKDIKTIIENAKKMNRFISLNSNKFLIANGMDKTLKDYFSIGNEVAEIVDDLSIYIKENIFKIMLSCENHERDLILANTKNVKIEAWWDKAIDIVSKNSDKGVAIKKILDFYGFKKDEAIAFGDGANDIDMFPNVGISVAMGNSSDVVKSKADFVCDSVNDDGVYKFLVSKKIIKDK